MSTNFTLSETLYQIQNVIKFTLSRVIYSYQLNKQARVSLMHSKTNTMGDLKLEVNLG